MRIAIPTKEGRIDNHFGHCEFFTLIDLNEQKEVIETGALAGSKECGCKSNLAEELAAAKVDLMLASGIGEGAIRKLKQQHIEVIAGFKGSVEEVLEKYLKNDYLPNFSICTDHHECSDH